MLVSMAKEVFAEGASLALQHPDGDLAAWTLRAALGGRTSFANNVLRFCCAQGCVDASASRRSGFTAGAGIDACASMVIWSGTRSLSWSACWAG